MYIYSINSIHMYIYIYIYTYTHTSLSLSIYLSIYLSLSLYIYIYMIYHQDRKSYVKLKITAEGGARSPPIKDPVPTPFPEPPV